MILNWFRPSSRKSSARTQKGTRPSPFRPALEALENRLVPATHQWTGNVSSAWSDSRNWVGGSPLGDSSAVLVFPSNPARLTSTNNLGVINIQEIQIFGTGYTIQNSASGPNRIVLGSGGISASTSTNVGTNTITASITLPAADRPVNVSGPGALTLAGVIDGSGGLLKGGTGQLIVSGPSANTYTGATTVAGGTLRLDKDVVDGAIRGDLIVGGADGTVGTVIFGGSHQIEETGTITVNPQSVLNLNGQTDFFRDVVLNAGTLQTGSGQAFVQSLTANSVLVGTTPRAAQVTGNLGSAIADTVFTVNEGPATNDLIITATLGGTNIIKAGAGRMDLRSDNDHTGVTRVNEGILRISHAAALGTSGAAAGTVVATGATLEVFAASGSFSVAEDHTLSGDGVAGVGALHMRSGGSAVFTRPVTLAGDVTLRADGGLFLNGVVSGNFGITKTGAAGLGLNAANTYTGVTTVSEGVLGLGNAQALGSTAAGTVVQSGASLSGSFTGTSNEPLTLNGTGISPIQGALSGSDWGGPITLASNTTVTAVADPIQDQVTILSGPISRPGELTLAGGGGFVFSGDAPNTYTGGTRINGGKLTLQKAPNTVAIPGTIIGGAALLTIASDEQIPDTTPLTLVPNSTLVVNAVETIGPLTLNSPPTPGNSPITLRGSGSLVFGGDVTVIGAAGVSNLNVSLGDATRTITVATDGRFGIGARDFGGGPGAGLIKAGEGRLSLSISGTIYTGPTTVEAGVLENVGSVAPSGPVTVNAGATLRGINLSATPFGDITLAGGTLNPGVQGVFAAETTGVVHSDGDVTFDASSTYHVDIRDSSAGLQLDQLHLLGSGTIDLGNARLDLVFLDDSQSLVGDTYTIVQNDTANPTTGFFTDAAGNVIPQGGEIVVNGQHFRINYAGGDFNDVVLTHVNTPPMLPNRSVTSVVREGDVAVLTGTISEPDPGDVFILEVDWGDGSPVETHTFPLGSDGQTVRLTHRYRDDNPSGTPEDDYTVRLFWHDQHGEGNTGELKVTVQNAAPEVDAGGNERLGRGGVLNRHGSFTDPGTDSWTATVDYGDGSGVQALELDRHGRFKLHHKYDRPGTYRVVVTVRDEDGGVGTDSFIVVVPRRGPRRGTRLAPGRRHR